VTSKVIIHVGHGKTGTSALQSYLAGASDKIAEHGFIYPSCSDIDEAKRGRVTSGNITLPSDGQWFQKSILPTLRQNSPRADTYIFSNETIFFSMQSLFNAINTEQIRPESLEILLAIRNPQEMICSAYQQAVKYDGITLSFDEFLRSQRHICHHTAAAAKLVLKLKHLGVEFKLFNYSRLGYNIVEAIAHHIGIANYYSASEFKNKTINRSLSYAELHSVLLVNQLYPGAKGRQLARALVNEARCTKTFRPPISSESLSILSNNMQPFLDTINSILPPQDCLVLSDSCAQENDYSMRLSDQQATIVRSFLSC
jgi:hypothetical protein